MSAPFAPRRPGAVVTPPRIVGLCEGYGGLTKGVQAVLGGTLVAYAEIKAAAVALLAARHPDVPNLGDLTIADWAQVVADIITVGWPCQPHSAAGLRLGEEDPRAIWPAVLDVIRIVRPAVVVAENVARVATNGELRRVVRSLAAIGYVGAWRCLPAGDPSIGAPHKRDRLCLVAIDATRAGIGELVAGWADAAHAESLGRDARRAGSAGELGGRDAALGGGGALEGVTLLPTPEQKLSKSGPDYARAARPASGGDDLTTAITRLSLLPTPNVGMGKAGTPDPELAQARLDSGRRNLQDAVGAHLLPTPNARDWKGPTNPGERPPRPDGRPRSEADGQLPDAVRLLPTPSAQNYGTNQGGAAGRVGEVRESLDTMARRGRFDSDEPVRLLPTPTVVDSKGGRNNTQNDGAGSKRGHAGTTLCDAVDPRSAVDWGVYAPAIARWEAVLDREAPSPTQPSSKAPHNPQLSPAFVEWMMGLPEGWVTAGAPGLGHNKRGRWTAPGERNAFLSLLGDGVVPQWAAYQVAHLLPLALEAASEATGGDFFDALLAGLIEASTVREFAAILAGAVAPWAPEHLAVARLRTSLLTTEAAARAGVAA